MTSKVIKSSEISKLFLKSIAMDMGNVLYLLDFFFVAGFFFSRWYVVWLTRSVKLTMWERSGSWFPMEGKIWVFSKKYLTFWNILKLRMRARTPTVRLQTHRHRVAMKIYTTLKKSRPKRFMMKKVRAFWNRPTKNFEIEKSRKSSCKIFNLKKN